jgi:hypothetical protein
MLWENRVGGGDHRMNHFIGTSESHLGCILQHGGTGGGKCTQPRMASFFPFDVDKKIPTIFISII